MRIPGAFNAAMHAAGGDFRGAAERLAEKIGYDDDLRAEVATLLVALLLAPGFTEFRRVFETANGTTLEAVLSEVHTRLSAPSHASMYERGPCFHLWRMGLMHWWIPGEPAVMPRPILATCSVCPGRAQNAECAQNDQRDERPKDVDRVRQSELTGCGAVR